MEPGAHDTRCGTGWLCKNNYSACMHVFCVVLYIILHIINPTHGSELFSIACMQARSDASHGRTTSALLKSRIALGLNVLAVILYIVSIMLAMVLAGVLVVGDFSYSSSYYCSYCNADLGLPCYYSYSYSIEFVYHYSYTYSVRYLYHCYY